jgi:hypothetical protein
MFDGNEPFHGIPPISRYAHAHRRPKIAREPLYRKQFLPFRQRIAMAPATRITLSANFTDLTAGFATVSRAPPRLAMRVATREHAIRDRSFLARLAATEGARYESPPIRFGEGHDSTKKRLHMPTLKTKDGEIEVSAERIARMARCMFLLGGEGRSKNYAEKARKRIWWLNLPLRRTVPP